MLLVANSANIHAAIIRTTWNNKLTGVGQTNVPADAEVREEQGTTARGDNQELATRGNFNQALGTGTQNSVMLMRFDVSGITAGDLAANPFISLRLAVDTTSWSAARSNSVPANPATGVQFGLEYYGLNTSAAGQNWDEGNVTYQTAPGLTNDSNVLTKDFNSDTTLLGTRDFVPIHTSNFLPVGFSWDFTSDGLVSFIQNAITGGAQFVTILASRTEGSNNFNYIFSSNDETTLQTQGNYDPDGGGPLPQGVGPYSASPAAAGKWEPMLIFSDTPIPEPASATLLLLGSLLVATSIRRERLTRGQS
jgi:hypothetical protein